MTDGDDPARQLEEFLRGHGLPVVDLGTPAGDPRDRPAVAAAVLVGADAAAVMAGAAIGAPTPATGVPDAVAVAYDLLDRPVEQGPAGDGVGPVGPARPPARSRATRLGPPRGRGIGRRGPGSAGPAGVAAAAEHGGCQVGDWRASWTDAEHLAAVRAVRAAIADGEVYQVNVVGHRSAPYTGDPLPALAALTRLPGAAYGGMLAGDGWAVASASPESLVTVAGGVARTGPVKGTRPATAAGRAELLGSAKERAEHVMIVDLERNDLGRLAVPGSVRVERLYGLREWAGLWQAESVVAARLRPGVGLAALLRALLPGGSVTGAPKLAAVRLAADLEPVGRGPAMGALGLVTADRVDLGLTIRTVAADGDRLHLWAGGGVTWGSDPVAEVAEAQAKAGPIVRALAGAVG